MRERALVFCSDDINGEMGFPSKTRNAFFIFFRFVMPMMMNSKRIMHVSIRRMGRRIIGIVFVRVVPDGFGSDMVAKNMPHLLFWIVNMLFQLLVFPGRIVFSSRYTLSALPHNGRTDSCG